MKREEAAPHGRPHRYSNHDDTPLVRQPRWTGRACLSCHDDTVRIVRRGRCHLCDADHPESNRPTGWTNVDAELRGLITSANNSVGNAQRSMYDNPSLTTVGEFFEQWRLAGESYRMWIDAGQSLLSRTLAEQERRRCDDE